jgi:transposase-like protein
MTRPYNRADKYKKFPSNIQTDAVDRVRNGEDIKTVADSIGCNKETLKKWLSLHVCEYNED